MGEYDVVIIGAGFTGLYTAYRLLCHDPYLKIAVYEKSPRVGGRILTEHRHGHTMEYGPMRFEPDLQPKFARLLEELNVQTKIFPPYTTPFKAPCYNEITFQEIQAIEADKSMAPSFALLKYALKSILHEQWDVDNDDIKDSTRNERKEWLKAHGRFQGSYLHEIGLWDALAHVLSKPAIDYIMHNGTFYHMIECNPNAADIIVFILDILATSKYHLITIEGGTDVITTKLYTKTREKVDFFLNSGVSEFVEEEDCIRIRLEDGQNVSGKRMIFTCQKNALKSIGGWDKFPTVSQSFESVFVIELYKIFVVLENPPWDATSIPKPNYNADKMPCREVHYYYNESNKTGMVMIYGDVPSVNYWRTFTYTADKSYTPYINHSSRLKDHVHHYLRTMFPKHRHFNIVDCGILDWSNPPHETGVHMWRPGYKSSEIMKQFSCLGKNKNIHICGEAYSTYQGFIEGCIRSADNMLADVYATQQ